MPGFLAPRSHYWLAHLYTFLKRNRSVSGEFRRALDLDPRMHEAWRMGLGTPR